MPQNLLDLSELQALLNLPDASKLTEGLAELSELTEGLAELSELDLLELDLPDLPDVF
jgi:hypothetical protein